MNGCNVSSISHAFRTRLRPHGQVKPGAAAAATLAALTLLTGCGAGGTAIVAADGIPPAPSIAPLPASPAPAGDRTSAYVPSVKPFRTTPAPEDPDACDKVAELIVESPALPRRGPAYFRPLSEATDRVTRRSWGAYTLRRADADTAMVRHRSSRTLTLWTFHRDRQDGWSLAGSTAVKAGCPSMPLDAEFARNGTPMKATR